MSKKAQKQHKITFAKPQDHAHDVASAVMSPTVDRPANQAQPDSTAAKTAKACGRGADPNFVAKAYLIRTITNLHMGDLNGGLSIVDLPVQRDVVTNYPTIHASGLKGSLRNAFEEIWDKESDEGREKLYGVFGGEGDDQHKGPVKFLNPLLFAYPMRGDSTTWASVSCKDALQSCLDLLKVTQAAPAFRARLAMAIEECDKAQDGERFEDAVTKRASAEDEASAFPSIRLMQNDAFRDVIEDLPVIARNVLENGVSKNLWYEEYVPRECLFLSVILMPRAGAPGSDQVEAVHTYLCDQLHQMGASASVGYGFVKFLPLA